MSRDYTESKTDQSPINMRRNLSRNRNGAVSELNVRKEDHYQSAIFNKIEEFPS